MRGGHCHSQKGPGREGGWVFTSFHALSFISSGFVFGPMACSILLRPHHIFRNFRKQVRCHHSLGQLHQLPNHALIHMHTHTVGHDMFQLSLASPYLDKPVNTASTQKFMDILNAAPFLHLGGRQGAEFTE